MNINISNRRSSDRAQTKPNKRVFSKKRLGCPLSLPGCPKIDYKDPELLKLYLANSGRILPSRITNVSAGKQRQLSKAVKIARILALLPFVSNNVIDKSTNNKSS